MVKEYYGLIDSRFKQYEITVYYEKNKVTAVWVRTNMLSTPKGLKCNMTEDNINMYGKADEIGGGKYIGYHYYNDNNGNEIMQIHVSPITHKIVAIGVYDQKNGENMQLIYLTILHFFTDGICGATLAEYALEEPYYEPIIYYFTMYTILAFGSQFIFGYMLDKKENLLSAGFIVAPIFLVAGGCLPLNIFTKVLFIGLGNSIFHIIGGSLIMKFTKGYSQAGIFVASGAVGLGLGLNSIVTTEIFAIGMIAVTMLVMRKYGSLKNMFVHYKVNSIEKSSVKMNYKLLACIVLLLSCIVLRGFGGGGDSTNYVMLFPCVFALGKSLGGICADKVGYLNTVMLILIGGFVSLQFNGLIPLVMLTFFCNMTMPLTLRLLCRCKPKYSGTMFGLAAGCLVPGFQCFLHGQVFLYLLHFINLV